MLPTIAKRLGIFSVLFSGVCLPASGQPDPGVRYDDIVLASGASHYDQPIAAAAAVPPEVEAAVKAFKAQSDRDITGKVFFKDQILKASTVRFADYSSLILTNPTLPWVAIAAKELVIDSPRGRATITRPTSPEAEAEFAKKLRGTDGARGPIGSHASGVNQHGHGYSGNTGGDGTAATAGKTQQLPTLYVFAGRIRWGTTPSEPPYPGLLVMYDGIRGGAGGKGGDAGVGGNGYPGADGDSDLFNCRRGPGDGGHGGYGGRGGRGGPAGQGGDGGSVILAGPDNIIADFILVRQEGGHAGEPGPAGLSARGGYGARGGRPRGHCHGNGRHGIHRAGTVLSSHGDGDPAPDGLRGMKDYVGFAIERVF